MCKEKNFEETPEFAKIYPEKAEFSYFWLNLRFSRTKSGLYRRIEVLI